MNEELKMYKCIECGRENVYIEGTKCLDCTLNEYMHKYESTTNTEDKKVYRDKIDELKSSIDRRNKLIANKDKIDARNKNYELTRKTIKDSEVEEEVVTNNKVGLVLCPVCHKNYIREDEACCSNCLSGETEVRKIEQEHNSFDNNKKGKYRLCPICQLNYITYNQSCCNVCRRGKYNVNKDSNISVEDAIAKNKAYLKKKKENSSNFVKSQLNVSNVNKNITKDSNYKSKKILNNDIRVKNINGKNIEVYSIDKNPKYDFSKLTSMQRSYLAVKKKSYENYVQLQNNKIQMVNGVTKNGKVISGKLKKAFEINTRRMEAKKKALDATRQNLSRIVYSDQQRAKKIGLKDYQYIRDSAMAYIFNFNKKRMNKK